MTIRETWDKIPALVKFAAGLGSFLAVGYIADSHVKGYWGLPSEGDIINGRIVKKHIVQPLPTRFPKIFYPVYDVADSAGNIYHFESNEDIADSGQAVRFRVTGSPNAFFEDENNVNDKHGRVGRHYLLNGERVQ